MNDSEKMIRQTVEEGGLYCILFFDMSGKEKEGISNLLVEFVARINKEPGVVFSVGEIDEPVEYGDEFITSAEVKVLTKSFATLVNLCMQFSPFGVEIMQPETIKLEMGEAQNLLLYVSQTGYNFSKYIVEKVLSPDEREVLMKKFKVREEMGKKLREKDGKKDSGEKSEADNPH